MGLFDSYFDPEQFRDSGGLLGRLSSLQQQQGQFQLGPGFDAPDRASAPAQAAMIPMPAPRPAAPEAPDAGPGQTIAIGDYQMPQFVGANAPQTVQQQPALGDRLSAGFQSWAHTPAGNPFAAIANGVSGFSSGQRNDPAAVAQQMLKSSMDAVGNPQPDLHARYQALRPIIGDRNAMLAVVHPEVAQSLFTQALDGQAKVGNSGVVDPADGDRPGLGNDTDSTAVVQSGAPASKVAAGNAPGYAARGGPREAMASRSNAPGLLVQPVVEAKMGKRGLLK